MSVDEALSAARAALARQDPPAAFAAFRRAAEADAGCVEAYAGMADLLDANGEPGRATQVMSRALAEARDQAGRAAAAQGLARRLAGLRPTAWHPVLERDLLACLETPEVEAQTLARPAALALLMKPEGGDDALWTAFLTRCLNVDPAMEHRLAETRRTLADRPDWTPEETDLACALAIQAWAGEYAWPVSGDEAERATAGDALRCALYRALTTEEAEGLDLSRPIARLLVERTVREPAREAAMEALIPEIGGEGGAVSAAVRAQYEDNPYPRWAALPGRRAFSLREAVERQPGFSGRLKDGELAVLAAGCGTGFEPLDLAASDPGLRVTALDLSRRSLAYGMRRAEAMGVERVRFVRGDLLTLDPADGIYDVVSSTGVLHHLAEPEAGLARLAGVLGPGGAMRLALYSERARAPVKAARDLIAERGWAPTREGVRAFRAHVLALPDHAPLAGLRESEDFYSLSGCRDLVFHVQEHRYTPPQLGDLLASAGLRLVGFEAPPEAMARFREAFGGGTDPLDLALWDRLEQRWPTLFAGMYHLWAQKPGGAG